MAGDKTLKIAILLTAMDKMSSVVNKSVSSSQKRLASLNSMSNKALLLGGGGTALFAGSIKAAEESAIAQDKLEKAFQRSTKDYQAAAKAAENYAGKLQYQIGIEDEVIMGVQTKIAGLNSFSNQAARQAKFLEKATLAAFNLQAVGIGSAEDNIMKIGRAMNDPIKAMSILSKWQIKFTPQEKARITAMMRANKVMDAQRIIMDKISGRAPGMAVKNATAASKIHVAWSEVQETLGNAVLPAFLKFTRWLERVIPKVQKFLDKHQNLVKIFAAGSVALLGLGAAGKAFSFMFGPIGKIISGSTKTFSFFFTKIDGTTKFMKYAGPVVRGLGSAFKFVGNSLLQVGKFLLANPILIAVMAIAVGVYLIIKHWKSITAWFGRLWNNVKRIFSNTWQGIKSLFLNYTPYGLVIKHWDKIKGFFKGLWEAVKAPFVNFFNWIDGLATRFYNAGMNIIKSIWRGIKSFVSKPIDAVKNMVGKIRNFLPFSPAKTGPLKDIHKIKLMETIAATMSAKPMIRAMEVAMLQVMKYMGQMNQKHGGTVSPMGMGGMSIVLNSTVNVNGNANKTDFQKALDINNKNLLKQVEDAIRRKAATSFTGTWNPLGR